MARTRNPLRNIPRTTKLTTRPSVSKARDRRWTKDLTWRQQTVWKHMITFQRKHCKPPSIREMCILMGFKSTQAMMGHLRPMIKKGKVMHVGAEGGSRAYLAVFGDDRCPICGRHPLGIEGLSRESREPDPAKEPELPDINSPPCAAPRNV